MRYNILLLFSLLLPLTSSFHPTSFLPKSYVPSTLFSEPDDEPSFKVLKDLGDSTDDESPNDSPKQQQQPGSVFAQRPFTETSISDRVTELKTSDDPKQTRVILYIIISLLPVLFLVPLMLGDREFLPVESLPPVSM